MPMLGDILASARNSSSGFEEWLERRDPELSARVKDAALRQGLTVTGYVRGAIADFNRLAPEEDWATLTSSLRDTDDPGTTCLIAMVHWRLTVRGCADHSSSPDVTASRRAQNEQETPGQSSRYTAQSCAQERDRHGL